MRWCVGGGEKEEKESEGEEAGKARLLTYIVLGGWWERCHAAFPTKIAGRLPPAVPISLVLLSFFARSSLCSLFPCFSLAAAAVGDAGGRAEQLGRRSPDWGGCVRVRWPGKA